MKKNHFNWLTILLVAMFTIGFVSCGDDDEDELGQEKYGGGKNAGESNTTDLAVTSGAEEVGLTHATIYGYVNLSNEMALIVDIGFEYADNAAFTGAQKVKVKNMSGRQVSYMLTSLEPDKTFYPMSVVVM